MKSFRSVASGTKARKKALRNKESLRELAPGQTVLSQTGLNRMTEMILIVLKLPFIRLHAVLYIKKVTFNYLDSSFKRK